MNVRKSKFRYYPSRTNLYPTSRHEWAEMNRHHPVRSNFPHDYASIHDTEKTRRIKYKKLSHHDGPQLLPHSTDFNTSKMNRLPPSAGMKRRQIRPHRSRESAMSSEVPVSYALNHHWHSQLIDQTHLRDLQTCRTSNSHQLRKSTLDLSSSRNTQNATLAHVCATAIDDAPNKRRTDRLLRSKRALGNTPVWKAKQLFGRHIETVLLSLTEVGRDIKTVGLRWSAQELKVSQKLPHLEVSLATEL